MKIITFIFIFTTLFSGLIFGQKETFTSEQEGGNDSLEINNIESKVDSIRLEKTLQKISIDSVLLSSKFSDVQEFYKIDIYYRGNEIARISLSPCSINIAFQYSVGGSIVDYFLENKKLIFVDEEYTDNSRTGSCGAIDMRNKLYYSGDELIGTKTSESCYDTRINLVWLFGNFEKAYKISIDRIN